jgi:hypothetical protein
MMMMTTTTFPDPFFFVFTANLAIILRCFYQIFKCWACSRAYLLMSSECTDNRQSSDTSRKVENEWPLSYSNSQVLLGYAPP